MKNLTVILSVLFSMLTVVANAQTQNAESGTNWFAIILLGMVLVVPPVMYAIARAGKVYAKIKDAVREYREKKQRAEEAKYELAGLRGKLRSEFATLENYARAKKMSPQRKAEMDAGIAKVKSLIDALPAMKAELEALESEIPNAEKDVETYEKVDKNAIATKNEKVRTANEVKLKEAKEVCAAAHQLVERQNAIMNSKRDLIKESIAYLVELKEAIELGEDFEKAVDGSNETQSKILGIVNKMSDDLASDTTNSELEETKDKREMYKEIRSEKRK